MHAHDMHTPVIAWRCEGPLSRRLQRPKDARLQEARNARTHRTSCCLRLLRWLHLHKCRVRLVTAGFQQAEVELTAVMLVCRRLCAPEREREAVLCGCHVSMAGGIERAVVNAASVGEWSGHQM